MKEKRGKEVSLDYRLILLSIGAGLLYYAAYYFKVPNSYTILLLLAFLIPLMKRFTSQEGMKPLIYMLIYTAVYSPLMVLVIPISIYFQLGLICFNWAILLMAISGFKQMRYWGMYVGSLALMTSAVTLMQIFELTFSSAIPMNVFAFIFMLKNILSLAFVLAAFAYLVNMARLGKFH